MLIFAAIVGLSAGICLHAAITHAQVGLTRHPRDMTRIIFAAAAVFAAANSLAVLALHSASSVTEFSAVERWWFVPTLLLNLVTIVLFVALYTGFTPRRLLMGLGAWFAVAFAVNLASPLGIFRSTLTSLRSSGLSPGLVVVGESSTNPLVAIGYGFAVAAFLFILFATYRQLRSGPRNKALPLAAAVAVVCLGAIFDPLVDSGTVRFIYVGQFAFLAFVGTMSYVLRRDTLANEERMKNYRLLLEATVENRVKELDTVNQNLAREIEIRDGFEKELERRVKELDALNTVSRTLAGTEDLGDAISEASTLIGKLFQARYVHIFLWRGPSGRPAVLGADTEPGPAVGAPREVGADMLEMPVLAEMLERRKPLVVSSATIPELPAEVRSFLEARGCTQLALFPLVATGATPGFMTVARGETEEPGFSEHSLALGETLAQDIAARLENERLRAAERSEVASQERNRLARDIHDAVTQRVYAACLIAESLPGWWYSEPSEGRVSLVRLRRLVRGALAELRSLLFELRPEALVAVPLRTLLAQLCDGLQGQIQVEVEADIPDGEDPAVEVKVAVYRAVQELFNNITKHAQASGVRVVLTEDAERDTLTIVDDGRGFDPHQIGRHRLGLRMMGERLSAVGVSREIVSAPGKGTTTRLVWPRLVPAARLPAENGDS